MQTPKSEKRKQEILTCDACGIEVNSQQMMDAHIRGQKHIKKMKLKVKWFCRRKKNLYYISIKIGCSNRWSTNGFDI